MRLFISGSAPLLTDTFDEFKARIGPPILERYGMSETIMLTSNPYDSRLGERIGGTVDQPLPGVMVRVVDDAESSTRRWRNRPCASTRPQCFLGLLAHAGKTREEFTVRRLVSGRATSDVLEAIRHSRSLFSIVGRSKDLIISGGFNVYPKEIESLIDDIPGVDESAVIGVPHPDFGEAVVAVVVPRAGAKIDAEAMMAD